MKFQADREVLIDAISFVVRLLSPRPQLPQLSGVLIQAEAGTVTFSIFDYEVAGAGLDVLVEHNRKIRIDCDPC